MLAFFAISRITDLENMCAADPLYQSQFMITAELPPLQQRSPRTYRQYLPQADSVEQKEKLCQLSLVNFGNRSPTPTTTNPDALENEFKGKAVSALPRTVSSVSLVLLPTSL